MGDQSIKTKMAANMRAEVADFFRCAGLIEDTSLATSRWYLERDFTT